MSLAQIALYIKNLSQIYLEDCQTYFLNAIAQNTCTKTMEIVSAIWKLQSDIFKKDFSQELEVLELILGIEGIKASITMFNSGHPYINNLETLQDLIYKKVNECSDVSTQTKKAMKDIYVLEPLPPTPPFSPRTP